MLYFIYYKSGGDIINTVNWMSSIPDSINIKNLNIPGAHDASTRFCRLGLFSSCQNLSIKEMLSIGVRALDLRVDGKAMVHSFVKCQKSRFGKTLTIHDVIKDIFDFLNANPSETVIVFFKNDGKTSGKICLDILKEIINKAPEKWYLENEFPCISNVRGKIILFNRIDSSIGIDFTRMPYQGGTKNTCAQDFSPNGKDSVTVQDRYFLNPLKKWKYSVKPSLENEQSGNCVVNHLSTAGFPFVPRFNSAYINKKFADFPLKKRFGYGILMADFQSSELTLKIIKTNFQIK